MKEMFLPKQYTHLFGLEGLSDALLKDHFTLYEGYVKNVSLLAEEISQMATATPISPALAEMKRRFAWEWNGMRLHELYFENMARVATLPAPDLATLITTHFGSLDNLLAEIRLTGTMRGIGWVILAYDPARNGAFVTWVNEHDTGHLSGTAPLLVMDVFEHAYIRDYGLKRAEYIESFLQHIDFEAVSKRLQ